MANTPFLITGLPRSRTAWLARVATIEGWSKCEHEPSIRLGSYDHLLAYWNAQPGPYLGISDYHLSQILPNILKTVQSRTLIVGRDHDEVRTSLRRVGLNDRPCTAALKGMASAIGDPLVKTISY